MYLVVGANGFLGRYIIKSILTHTSDNIIATARNLAGVENAKRLMWYPCEITENQQFDAVISKVRELKKLKVIFLAAYHHPDLVAENPQKAWDINVTALSKCINKLYFADKLFYASTDSVYGNSIANYHFKETDSLNPVNLYGKNKAAAESIIHFYGFNVIRFPFLIAPSLVNGKMHFYDKIVAELKNGNPIRMFRDSYRSSLNFETAADLLIQLAERKEKIPSILNICGDKDLSKYEIGLKIARKLNVDENLVQGIEMDTDIFHSPRALSTLMDNSELKKILGIKNIDFVI